MPVISRRTISRSRCNPAASWAMAPVAAALVLALSPIPASALPHGGVVAAGIANIATNGATMTVAQSTSSATYNWQSFSIGQAEAVHFQQPSANSVALNYVLGNTNSIIDGSLTSNGQLFLSNPNGLLFGANSQVNVAGLTLDAGNSQISNAGKLNVNSGALTTRAGFINNTGIIEASSATQVGGRIVLTSAGGISNTGTLRANGSSGGSVLLTAGTSILQQGAVLADGTTGAGGSINLTAVNRIIQNSSALAHANGATDGGIISYRTDTGTVDGGLMLSGAINTNGASGRGGSLILTGTNVELLAVILEAKGIAAGGNISVGGGFQGKDATIANAQKVNVNAATTINASASSGDGGNVVVWSDLQTTFSGSIKAIGGAQALRGGQVEVSGKSLGFNGMVKTATTSGINGSLLLDPVNITIQAGGPATPALFSLGKAGSLTELKNGNLVVANPIDSTMATLSGTVWLFSPNGALISTLTGMKSGDLIQSKVLELPNGNLLLHSPLWDNATIVNAGALTWIGQASGVSGVISASNSIVGGNTGDMYVPSGLTLKDFLPLPSGNLLWRNPYWGPLARGGAVTFINGNAPTTGTFLANSLTGASAYDSIGSGGITILPSGNYLVSSPNWGAGSALVSTGKGALTWGSGTTGVAGTVSAKNSLVGSTLGDGIGYVKVLSNGNYLVISNSWSNGAALHAGAVTWADGNKGISGVVSAANSLVGTQTNDAVGFGPVRVTQVVTLKNGNYLVYMPNWDNGSIVDAGALTWGSGSTGVRGAISAANSIVGTVSGDLIGFGWANRVVLPSGNMIWVNPNWKNGAATNAGAVMFIKGEAPTTGTVLTNSLVGKNTNDEVGRSKLHTSSVPQPGITVLPNGNYLVVSERWNGNRGAVTWGSGTTGVTGVVSSANSLVGSTPGNWSTSGDRVGLGEITILANGNYVISSNYWGDMKGAVTWGNAATGVSGVVSATNSLVGGATQDLVASHGYLRIGSFTEALNEPIITLPNGDYIVSSPVWGSGKGAVTWGSGVTGVTGTVSAANSLVGSKAGSYTSSVGSFAGDNIGVAGITVLPSGNYVVSSPGWSNGTAVAAGAVTWGSGTTGVKGVVSATNSLVGTSSGDGVGLKPIQMLPSGDYLVSSPLWSNGTAKTVGAVTRGSELTGVIGPISAANSLVGTQSGDAVGGGGVAILPSGNYVIASPLWNNGTVSKAGAVTWVKGSAKLTGTISANNSLVGTQANDRVGYGSLGGDGIAVLPNGNYFISSPDWSNGAVAKAGAVTWGSGSKGVTGAVSAANSLVGEKTGDIRSGITSYDFIALPTGNYLWGSTAWNDGAKIGVGAVTFMYGNKPTTGTFRAHSLIGSTARDGVGEVTVLSNGNYLVTTPLWDNGPIANAGAMTWGSGQTGVSGVVSASNSIVGQAYGEYTTIKKMIDLPTGNYLLVDSTWGTNGKYNMGVVTFIKGSSPTLGTFRGNSLVGSSTSDGVGYSVTVLPSGNYLVESPDWGNHAGAVTWGSGVRGRAGTVSAANSLVGANSGPYGDNLGTAVTVLPSGNYLVIPSYGGGKSVTWGSGLTGITGVVSAKNSLIGVYGNITILPNGNYVIADPTWSNYKGAITWGNGLTGVTGVVSSANSLVGSTGSINTVVRGKQGDQVGNGCPGVGNHTCNAITVLPSGDFIVSSPNWSNGLVSTVGAVTWVNGKKGITGVVSSNNSMVGSESSDYLGRGTKVLANGNIAVSGKATPWNIFAPTIGMAPALGYSYATGQTLKIAPSAITNITNAGTAVTLQASSDIVVNSVIVTTPNAGIATGGALTLRAGRSILINASITTANGALTLIGNDLVANGVVVADRQAGAAVITQAAGTVLNTGSGRLTVDLRSGGAGASITLANLMVGNLSVNNATGGISQQVGSVFNVARTSDLTAVSNINFSNIGNDFVGAVTSKAGGATALTDVNALTAIISSTGKGTVKAGGNLLLSGSTAAGLSVTTTGAASQLSFGNLSVGGKLVANSGFVINQGGVAANSLTVTGSSTLAAANNINLSNAGNDFVGAVNTTAGALTLLTDLNALTVALNSTGATTLNAGGGLTVAGTVGGALTSTTSGVLGATTFGNTTVGGVLNVTSSGVVSRAIAVPAVVVKASGANVTDLTKSTMPTFYAPNPMNGSVAIP